MDTTVTQSWRVSGMHCSSCGIFIDEAVEELDGVTSSSTSVKKRTTTVTFNPTSSTPDQVAGAIVDAGYQAVPVADTGAGSRKSWFRRSTS